MSQPLPVDIAFEQLLAEFDQLLKRRSGGVVDKKALLADAARRFEIEQQLIVLLSPKPRGPAEKRGNVRVPCELPGVVSLGPEQHPATVRDLSCGGVKVDTALLVPGVDATVQLELAPVDGLAQPLPMLQGRVAWLKPGSIGIAFVPQPGVELRMLRLVLHLLRTARPTAR